MHKAKKRTLLLACLFLAVLAVGYWLYKGRPQRQTHANASFVMAEKQQEDRQ